MELLSALTSQQLEQVAVEDGIRFLCHTALNDYSALAGAEAFLATSPRSPGASMLRQAVASGELYEKSVAPASTTDLANAGHLLPPAWLDPLIRRMQTASILTRIPGIEHVPPNVPVPYETAAPALTWVPQNAPVGVTKLTLASHTLRVYKFGGILVQTRELARLTEGGGARVIASRLLDASTRFLDSQVLDPAVAAVADRNPASLTNGVAAVPAGANPDATIDALVAAFYATRPNATRPTFVMSPASASTLARTGKNPGLDRETGKTLGGDPVVTTIGAGARVIFLDASGILAYDGGGDVAPSPYAMIEMEATPTSPPTAATISISLWHHNLIGFRLSRYCDWKKEPTAVAYAATL